MSKEIDKKNPTEPYIKPRFWMYNLHSLHGQFSGCLFLITFLKACNVSFLNSLGIIFHIFGSRNQTLSVYKKHFLNLVIEIEETVVNCNHYSLIEIIVSR